MNKKIILLSLSYLLIVLCVYIAYLIFDMTVLSCVYIIFYILILLFAPFFIYKFIKLAKMSGELRILNFYIFMFVVSIVVYMFMSKDSLSMNNIVAITESRTKAEEIQTLLTTKDRITTRELIKRDTKDVTEYCIGLHHFNKKDYRKAIIELLNSQILDDSVHIYVNRIYSRNPQKMLKRSEEEIEWIIWRGMTGLQWIEVKIELNVPIMTVTCKNVKNTKVKKVTARFAAKEDADDIKLERDIEKLLSHIFDDKDNPVEIIVKDSGREQKAYAMCEKAYEVYINGNYTEALNLLNETVRLNSSYSFCLDSLKQFIDVDNRIKKFPNNYKLYIERGDLKNGEFLSLFPSNMIFTANREGAIEDYNKALELNPNAYEVYAKRGDAWANVNHSKNKLSFKEIRYPEDNQNAIKDYLKAIEYTGGNDYVYEQLGDLFDNTKDKLYYYKKIKKIYLPALVQKPIKHPIESVQNKLKWFDFYSYSFVPLKIVFCYDRLEQYDEALNVLDDIIKYQVHMEQASNLKFYYNWKAGHYKEALKNADNCSVWVCRLAGIFF